MAKQSSPQIDRILEEAQGFTFPRELQFNEYRDRERQADVIQVFFRYHPFSEVEEKFAFELAFTDKAQTDRTESIRRREIRRHLSDLEAMWKNKFNFIFYRGVPYAKEIDGNTYRLKCELCAEQVEITQDDDVKEKQDLYLIFALKNIDCDCEDGWEAPPVDQDMVVPAGTHFPRTTV